MKFSLSNLLLLIAMVAIVVAFAVVQRSSKNKIQLLEKKIGRLEEFQHMLLKYKLVDLNSELIPLRELYTDRHPTVYNKLHAIRLIEDEVHD